MSILLASYIFIYLGNRLWSEYQVIKTFIYSKISPLFPLRGLGEFQDDADEKNSKTIDADEKKSLVKSFLDPHAF